MLSHFPQRLFETMAQNQQELPQLQNGSRIVLREAVKLESRVQEQYEIRVKKIEEGY